MDPETLFPEFPEDVSSLSDDEVDSLLDEHMQALDMIDAQDAEFIGELSGEDIVSQTEKGVEQIKALRALKKEREEAQAAYQSRLKELSSEVRVTEEAEEVEEEEVAEEEVEELEEAAAEVEEAEEDEEEADDEEAEAVAAAASKRKEAARRTPVYRKPPAAPAAREPEEKEPETQLVAAAGAPGLQVGKQLDALGFAKAVIEAATRLGRPTKQQYGVEDRVLLATAEFGFPKDHILYANDLDGNTAKLRRIGSPFLGGPDNPFMDSEALVASGGLCAPLTPFYAIPDFAVTDRPVRDALPSFRAERGGVSVPSVSTIGSITSAITVIEEDEDALGGTFATKSCQDMTCASWTDVAVGIIAHCREYGNLNNMAWPEGIAHENNLTMAAHARTAETRLLDRIKALSINVTTAHTYNAVHDLIYAVTRAAAGIRFRLRLNRSGPSLRAMLPAWLVDLLVADFAAQQVDVDRFVAQARIEQILRNAGIAPVWYLDDVTGGTSQGFADETASALDDFPDDAQWALFVEGEFLHLDGGVLELGIVRDSTLNSTNDFQVFGETFENVARIGPVQGALWVTSEICPTGQFPDAATALTC